MHVLFSKQMYFWKIQEILISESITFDVWFDRFKVTRKKTKKKHERIGSASDARNRIRRDDVYLQAIFFGKNSNFDACD